MIQVNSSLLGGIIKRNNGNDQLICHLGLIVLNAPILLDDAFKTLSQATKWISVSLIKIDDLEMSQQYQIRTWNPEVLKSTYVEKDP